MTQKGKRQGAEVDPLGDGVSSVVLIQFLGGDTSIVRAARVSHANDWQEASQDRDYALIRYLLEHRHGTPFEHNQITFRVTAPLFVIQEMLRHRIGVSFNQESHRYIEVKNRGYVPRLFRAQSLSNRQASVEDAGGIDQEAVGRLYQETVSRAYEAYEQLLACGVCREQARGVLPHGTYSSLFVTFNLRSLLHFLDLREPTDAQWEIRQYAKAFRVLVEPFFPLVFRVLREIRGEQEDVAMESMPHRQH